MWKVFGWLGKSAAAAVLVSFLAIWTTGYIVNSYVESLIKQYNLPIETRPFALSGVWGTLWGVEAGKEASVLAEGGFGPSTEDETGDAWTGTDGATDPAAEAAAEPDAAGTPADGETVPGGAEGTPTETGTEPRTETGSGTGSEAQSGAGQAGEAVVTTEEMAEAKAQLSEEDRNKLFAILVSKLPQEEWQTISGYVEGGLTEDELLNVQQIVAKYLNDAEYGELMEILSKY